MPNEKQNYGPALAVLTSLFFMWGFITCLNSILVPYLQGVFQLSKGMSNFINSAFFIAFFVMSVPASEVVKKAGYKMGCVIGLIVCAVGAFLYYPSGAYTNFALFLIATFVIATGVTILQVAANPFVTILGHPDGASARLNMTQGFNSLGTYVAPLIGNLLILKGITETMSAQDKAAIVKNPYIGLGVLCILLAIVFSIFKLPEPKSGEGQNEAEKSSANAFESLHSSAWGYRHVILGMFGIFAYVGAEVAVGSNIIFYLKDSVQGMTDSGAAPFVAIYWGGAMIGRFYASLMLSKGGSAAKTNGLAALVAVGAFIISYIALKSPGQAAIFFGIAVANYLAFQIGARNDKRTLGIFAIIAAILAASPMVVSGSAATWTICSIGLFNSMMFPTIFSLGVAKLGKHTPTGSGALVMGIVGGAIIPPIWGFVADATSSVKIPFLVCTLCYAYIAFYGMVGSHPEEVKTAA